MGADSILFATAHRPWPAPMAPWIMTQRWNDLLFLHYPVAPEALRPLVPDVLTLDTYKQRAWVTITPFWINHLRPPGVPSLPWLSHFSEINVRTYVTYDGKPGVYFFSLDASNLSSVWGARRLLPAALLAGLDEGERARRSRSWNTFPSGSTDPSPRRLRCSYGPASDRFHARPGSTAALPHRALLSLLRYSRKRLYRGEIHHLPWDLQQATVEVEHNTMAQTAGIELPPAAELVYFARELKVLFWAPERLR